MTITVQGKTCEYPAGTTFYEIAMQHQAEIPQEILLAKLGTKLYELHKHVPERGGEISFITGADKEGHMAYQRSAICNNRSAAYREMGEYALARRDLRRAVSLLDLVDGAQDKRAVALVSLAQTLVKEGRLDEARREIDAALCAYETLSGGRDIHRPNAFACSGQIAYLMGDYRLAADQMHRAAEALRDKVGASPMVERLQEECRRMQRLADA